VALGWRKRAPLRRRVGSKPLLLPFGGRLVVCCLHFGLCGAWLGRMEPGEEESCAAVPSKEEDGQSTNVDNASTCLCGDRVVISGSSGEAAPPPLISVTVAPTTGGQFELKVHKFETIENVKKTISKRLKVPKERICLLWKDR
jgi:hypothetical protein